MATATLSAGAPQSRERDKPLRDKTRRLAGHWPDKELAVSLNRMLCKTTEGESWTTVRVREMRERLGLPDYDPDKREGRHIMSSMVCAIPQ